VLDQQLRPTNPINLLGGQFAYALSGETIAYDDTGVTVVLGLDTPQVAPLSPRGQAAPGSFSTIGGPPPLQTTSGVVVALDDDAINRLLHAAWAQGLLEVDLGPVALTRNNVTLPGGAPLTLGELTNLLPELLGAAPKSAPIAVKAETWLPPVLEVTGAPDLLRVSLGEVHLEVMVDRGQGFETLFKAVVHARVGATVAFVPNKGVVLTSSSNAEIAVDLIESPLVEMDERKLQVVVGTVFTPLAPRFINTISLVPLPQQIAHLSFVDLRAAPSGPDLEHLTVSLEMRR